MWVGEVIGREALVPGSTVLAAFVRETENEDEQLLTARLGEDDFGIVQGFGFYGRNGLRMARNRAEAKNDCNRERQDQASHGVPSVENHGASTKMQPGADPMPARSGRDQSN